MEELELLAEIVRTLSQGLKIPVFCKSRVYKDFDRTVRLYETLVNAGASAICVHGRTREEKGHAVGTADWDMIRRLREHFRGRIPIIANGGIACAEDIRRCVELTGVDAVMTSEAILENPALFTDSLDASGTVQTQIDLAEQYLHLCYTYPVWHIKAIRSHMMKMLHRYISKHTELREQVALAHSIEEFLDICKKCREIVGDRELEYADGSWYTRHQLSAEEVPEGATTTISYKKQPSTLRGYALEDDAIWECGGGSSNTDDGDEESDSIFSALGMFRE
jgi:tRNA-dihydrouridine synthase 1